ncbi:C40 family peptidase [Ferruginibacter sp.]
MRNFYIFFVISFFSCNYISQNDVAENEIDTAQHNIADSIIEKAKIKFTDSADKVPVNNINSITDSFPQTLITYAKTLIGTPYKYASVNPAEGLDCSGFITTVFNHFNIKVPRSSVDFTNYGITVDSAAAKPGDLILFTGTDSLSTIVGHMGIITTTDDGVINFIHSTSGKAYGVVITQLNNYYRKRFVKIVRIPFYNID